MRTFGCVHLGLVGPLSSGKNFLRSHTDELSSELLFNPHLLTHLW